VDHRRPAVGLAAAVAVGDVAAVLALGLARPTHEDEAESLAVKGLEGKRRLDGEYASNRIEPFCVTISDCR
jgi:hypothetical protein